LSNAGAYYIRVTKSELQELKKTLIKLKKLWKKNGKRIREWLELLTEKVDTKKILTMVMPGMMMNLPLTLL